MATFTELLADVYTLTNRPDLVAETTLAVKAATLKMHQRDFFPKDLFETGISFSTSEYQQQLDYRSILPRYRALKYIRKTDVTAVPGDFLSVILPEQTLDSYKVTKDNVVYLAGAVLQIRSSTLLQYIILGCYNNPSVDPTAYSSWIALDHPYAIVFEAARVVFKSIGFMEESSQMDRLVQEQVQELDQEISTLGF